jgi:hypothetical protein
MINVELEIQGEEVACCYLMGAGEIEALFVQLPDGGLVDMSDLLEFEHIYNAIEDHYHNMMLEAQVCH